MNTPTISLPGLSKLTGAPLPTIDDLERRGADIHYDGKRYLVRNKEGRYVPTDKADLKQDLGHLGFNTVRPGTGIESEASEMMRVIRTERYVEYAGPLAGKHPGPYTVEGRHILVTEDFDLPDELAGPGEWPIIKALLNEMLDAGAHIQTPYFLGWLMRSRVCLAAGKTNPGQVLAFAGRRDCGKTLLQSIITAVLGGRSASPYLYMTGQTSFSSDLFRAENLVFGDEISADTSIGARRLFGASIKRLTVNETQKCEGKGREPLTLRPFWRVTFSINDEDENLVVLPPLDESITDKLMLFHVDRPTLFDGNKWSSDRDENWRVIAAELPAFIYDLVRMEIPPELQERRFGIKSFLHPSLVTSVEKLAPERRLLDLIDVEIFGSEADAGERSVPFDGSAIELEMRLKREGNRIQKTIGRLLEWPGATGTYLSSLARKHPDRVKRRMVRGIAHYTIIPPTYESSLKLPIGEKFSRKPKSADL